MRILMTNHAMHYVGGTETWTETVATELINRGHDVEIATFVPGTMADRMPCRVRPIGDLGADSWDLMLVNHNTCLAMIQGRPGFKVFTSHGPAHNLEKPAPGADRYVAVSEEVRATYQSVNSLVVRNPIDTKRFRPRPALHPDAEILVMTKNAGASYMTMDACRGAGLTYSLAHYALNPVLDPSDLIPLHRAVITSGRGVLESLACGVPVFLLNHSGGGFFGDGWVTPVNVRNLQICNYSGRATAQPYDTKRLAQELTGPTGQYLMEAPGHSTWGPSWIEQHHDVEKVCDQYLNLVHSPQEEVPA